MPRVPGIIIILFTELYTYEQHKTVKIYEYCGENTELCQSEKLCLTRNLSTISSIEFSHDSKYVAVGDTSGKLFVYDCATGEVGTAAVF